MASAGSACELSETVWEQPGAGAPLDDPPSVAADDLVDIRATLLTWRGRPCPSQSNRRSDSFDIEASHTKTNMSPDQRVCRQRRPERACSVHLPESCVPDEYSPWCLSQPT